MKKADSTPTPDTPTVSHPSDEMFEQKMVENQREQQSKLTRFLRVSIVVVGAIIAVYVAVLGVLFLMGWTAEPWPFHKSDSVETAQADPIDLSTWSDEELAAQLCMVMVSSAEPSQIDTWTGRCVGAVLLKGENPAGELSKKIAAAQKKVPYGVSAFIASDEEGGQKQPLKSLCGPLASAQEMGTWTSAEIEDATKTYGLKLKDVGVNLVLAPSVDLGAKNGALTRAGRTFGSDVDTVSACAHAWISGMSKAGISTALKHWPGIGGYKDVSGALVSFNAWSACEQTSVLAFKKTISAATKMVLVTHVVIPELCEDDKPATISAEALKYLRADAGDGTIILADDVDALAKRKIETSSSQAAVDALIAGADMVMLTPTSTSDRVVIEAIAQAIASGKLSRAQAEVSVARIIRAKAQMGLSPALATRTQ